MDNLDLDKIFGGGRIPKQFIGEAKVIEVKSLVSTEEASKMNNEFQRECEILDGKDIESEIAMNDIVAGGTCYTKKLNRY